MSQLAAGADHRRWQAIQPTEKPGTCSAFIQDSFQAIPSHPEEGEAWYLQGFLGDGASRTRTGDLLGAIQASSRRFWRQKVGFSRGFVIGATSCVSADVRGYRWIPLGFRHSWRLVPLSKGR